MIGQAVIMAVGLDGATDITGASGSTITAAVIAALGFGTALFTWLRSRNAEDRGHTIGDRANIGEEWQMLTRGMREEIASTRTRVGDLEKLDAQKGRQITRLQMQNAQHEDQIAELREQNGKQAERISRLEKWKGAALRYIASLIQAILDLGGTPPEPPPDYTADD